MEKNVAADKSALQELQEMGYMTTPVIKIDGEVVVGFDRKRLDVLLSSKE